MSAMAFPDGTPVSDNSILGKPQCDKNWVSRLRSFILGCHFIIPGTDKIEAECFDVDALDMMLDTDKSDVLVGS